MTPDASPTVLPDPVPETLANARASRVKRATFILLTVLLAIAVSLLAFESLLRVLKRAEPVVSGWRGTTGDEYRFQHNQLGFRGVPIEYLPDDFVALLVGDSQVEAVACSYFYMPERRLEHYLSRGRRVRVFSLAAGGWGQDQELLALREYFEKYRADLVIVWETPGNDIWNNTFPTMDPAGQHPKPTFWLENGMLQGPTTRIGEVVSSRFHLVTAYQHLFVSRDGEWERRLPPPYVPMREYRGPVKMTWQSFWDHGIGNIRGDNMDTEKSHQAIHLTPRSPRTQYGIDLTHRLLEEMSREATAHGGSFVTFWVNGRNPEVDVEDTEEAVFVLNGKYYRVSGRQKFATMDDVNAGLEHYVQQAPKEEPRFSPTDGHLNEHAVDEVMHDLAEIIARRLGHS